MTYFTKLMLMLALTVCVLLPAARANDGVVYVVLFMHNEDTILGDFNEPQTETSYLRQRQGLVEMAEYLHENNVPFAWQSDWKFLQGVLQFETPELMATTNGKNLVRWLKEDMGISVDAHSHEHYGYNYADVACLIDSLGVPPTDIIGGHIWDPYIEQYANWERFRQPLQGNQYPHYTWNGRVLIGSGTPNHTYDPAPSGIWRPTDKYHYWQDDPNGSILCVGQYTGDVAGVEDLVQLYRSDAVSEDQILTCTIHTRQSFYSGFMDDFRQNLVEPLLAMQENGDIRLVDFVQLIDIWESDFSSQPHLYNAPEIPPPSTFGVRVPSDAAGSEGVFVQVSLPSAPRYDNQQAPVVVHVAGGWDGVGVTEKSHGLADQGFIELDFNFPGSGLPGEMSGGIYDERGENCIKALADVVQFAMGKQPDVYGHYLGEMIGEMEIAADNVGLCGWSNGGNATITAAGAFGEDVEGLAWIVNWESPVGDGMPNVDAGVRENLNPAYDPDTGQFDESTVAFDASLRTPEGETGSLYFDIDKNGALDMAGDYLAPYHLYQDIYYFSEWLRNAAENLGVPLPEHIATVEETANFWRWRNGEQWINKVIEANPDLMFIVEAGDVDHVQGAIDHPHVLIQYNGFLDAGARFVRLNPDRDYVEQVVGMTIPEAVDNDAFAVYDHVSIRDALQPRDIPALRSNLSVAAAVCELADRTRDDNVAVQIGDIPNGVDDRLASPQGMALYQNYPNPFNGQTVISFQLEENGMILLSIHDVTGRIVRQWRQSGSQGFHQLVWDGKDGQGVNVSSGVYFFRLQTDRGESMVRRMNYLK